MDSVGNLFENPVVMLSRILSQFSVGVRYPDKDTVGVLNRILSESGTRSFRHAEQDFVVILNRILSQY